MIEFNDELTNECKKYYDKLFAKTVLIISVVISLIFIIPSTPLVAGINSAKMFIHIGIDSFGHINPGKNMKISDVTTNINKADSLVLKK